MAEVQAARKQCICALEQLVEGCAFHGKVCGRGIAVQTVLPDAFYRHLIAGCMGIDGKRGHGKKLTGILNPHSLSVTACQ